MKLISFTKLKINCNNLTGWNPAQCSHESLERYRQCGPKKCPIWNKLKEPEFSNPFSNKGLVL